MLMQMTWDDSICSSVQCALKIYEHTIIVLKSSNGAVDNDHPSCLYRFVHVGLRMFGYLGLFNALLSLSFCRRPSVYLYNAVFAQYV